MEKSWSQVLSAFSAGAEDVTGGTMATTNVNLGKLYDPHAMDLKCTTTTTTTT